MQTTAAKAGHDPVNQQAIYVYEAPLRLWHWTHGISFIVLAVTGYFISHPMATVPGEASANFLMGNIRFIHFVAAYVFAIGFALRIYWAFVGNHHARAIFILPVWDKDYWRGLWYEIRFYSFLEKGMRKSPGHNPLAQTAAFFLNTIGTVFMILTGFALYSEGMGRDSWMDTLFGWVIPLVGDSEATHNWHNLGMWVMLVFVIIHVYMVIRADVIGR